MADRRRGLGRGIGALIPSNQEESKDSPIDIFFGGKHEPKDTSETRSTVSRETSTLNKAGKKPTELKTKTQRTSADKAKPAKSSSKQRDAETGSLEKGTKKKTAGSNRQEPINNENADLVAVPGATYAELPVESIVPNQKQPRNVFDEDDLHELAASIKEVGVLQPIIVRPLSEPVADAPQARYELIMGERRWRASQLAEQATVPAIVRRTADEDLLRDALLENLHRAQLNPLEEAAAYQQLLQDFNCTQEELSQRIARSRPQISNTLRLMKLPPLVQKRVAAQVLSAGHARALLGLSEPAAMERLAQRIVAEGLSVRQVEEIVAVGDEPDAVPTPRKRVKADQPELQELAMRLAERFDTKVTVSMGQRKGTVKIDFGSLEDLNRIAHLIAPGETGIPQADDHK